MPEDGAYAKLFGRNLTNGNLFEAHITRLPSILGRYYNGCPEDGFISLGNSTTISRIHAILGFDEKVGHYYIQPCGKSSITIRKVEHQSETVLSKSETSIALSGDCLGKRIKISSKDPIRIGNIGFYFLKAVNK